MEWYRPLPAPREVTWSARDNLNYQETGALAALDETASQSKEMLHNFYKKGWDSWQKGLTQPPYAFLIPEDQGDPARVAQMVERLMSQQIEVARAQNRNSDSKKEASLPEPTWFASISPTATTQSICSRRSIIRKMAKRPTMTFPGNCPRTIICRRFRPPMRPSVRRR